MKKLLDVYCGAGLAAIGYKQAGFHVTGVDNEKKTTYAGDVFILGDALEILRDVEFCRQFDAIHASPPCQKFSTSTALARSQGKTYPNLIPETRALLDEIGLPYIIENVPTAPIRPDIVLHGWMFGLHVMRKRAFEITGWWAMQPGVRQCPGSIKSGDFISVFGKAGYRRSREQCRIRPIGWLPYFHQGTIRKTWAYAMGIPPEYDFKDTEISEGIPPAYSRYLGGLLMEHICKPDYSLFQPTT